MFKTTILVDIIEKYIVIYILITFIFNIKETGHMYVDHIDHKLRVDFFTKTGTETLLILFKEVSAYLSTCWDRN